ncbi:hypothetical protein [Hyphococcus sp.]|uniref:hypothetical protein n=1 Tax=Hyphococcus sp. TaxID=2038636 RepID=UPI00207E53F4|nr:MAG: hypothetical protein DHS20C04_27570 [Marinicaulis sp.]
MAHFKGTLLACFGAALIPGAAVGVALGDVALGLSTGAVAAAIMFLAARPKQFPQ